MRSASLAEFLVRLVAGRDQAVAIVGDLVEIAQARGPVWFWVSIMRLLVARLSRPAAALLAGSIVSSWFSGSLMDIIDVHQRLLPPWVCMSYFVFVSCSTLAISAFYSAICYGIGDLYTRLAFALACLFALITFAGWLPGICYACISIFLGLLLFSALRARRRWALFTAGLTLAVAFFSWLAGAFALARYEHAVLNGHLVLARDYIEHSQFLWISLTFMIFVAFETAALCSFMHRRARRQALHISRPDDNPFDSRVS